MGFKKNGWVLVDQNDQPVSVPVDVVDFRGDKDVVVGGTPPHKPSSAGHVETQAGAEYFPGVFNLKWVEEAAPKVTSGTLLQINAPHFFKDEAFVAWLNNGESKFTWHKGGKPGDWSDVMVMVDRSLNGDGPDSDMPEHIWDQILKVCRDNLMPGRGIQIAVWIQNLEM